MERNFWEARILTGRRVRAHAKQRRRELCVLSDVSVIYSACHALHESTRPGTQITIKSAGHKFACASAVSLEISSEPPRMQRKHTSRSASWLHTKKNRNCSRIIRRKFIGCFVAHLATGIQSRVLSRFASMQPCTGAALEDWTDQNNHAFHPSGFTNIIVCTIYVSFRHTLYHVIRRMGRVLAINCSIL